jgi:hypothetical protein
MGHIRDVLHQRYPFLNEEPLALLHHVNGKGIDFGKTKSEGVRNPGDI